MEIPYLRVSPIRRFVDRPRRRDMRDALVLLYVGHCSDSAAGKVELLPFDRWIEDTARRSRLLQSKRDEPQRWEQAARRQGAR